MHIIGVQVDSVWEDKAATHERVRALLTPAKAPAGSLIVLPELFATGFGFNIERITEEPGRGETQDFLAQLAREHQCFTLGGLVLRGSDGLARNQCVIHDPAGDPVASYCKLHPFTFGGETRYYARGERPICFDWNGVATAPLICYDLRFPEVFRVLARKGVRLFAVIASWPSTRHEHWLTLLRARAIENQAYVIGVNRCGRDPTFTYRGGSRIIDPRGEILADAGEAEMLISAAVDMAELEDYRRSFPALTDIRDEFLPPQT